MNVELTIKGDVQRLHLEPSDTVLVRFDHDLTAEQTDRIGRQLKRVFPDHAVLILDHSATVEVAG